MSVAATGPGLRVGSVAGAPVRIGASWIVLAGAVVFLEAPNIEARLPQLGRGAIAVAIGYALILLGSVLVHEIGHALTARRMGQEVHAIVADLFGGHTSFDGRGLTPGPAAAIAAAGPAMNVVLSGLAWLLQQSAGSGVGAMLLMAAAWSNLLLAALNLLPALPLDGGQLLEAAVWRVTGSRNRGTFVSGWAGRGLAVLVVLWCVGLFFTGGGIGVGTLWALVIAVFLWRGASQSLARAAVFARLAGKTLADLMVRVPLVCDDHTVAQALTTAPGGGVVVDGRAQPVGIFTAEGAASVPADRRDRTPVAAVYHHQGPHWVIDVDSDELTPALQHMARHNLPYAVVRMHGRIVGALQAADVQRLLAD